MSKKALALIIVFSIAGCATQNSLEEQRQERDTNLEKQRQERVEKQNQELSAWHGKDINVLIAQWGAPTSTYQLPNGNMMYSYTRSIGEIFCTRSFTVDKKLGLIINHSLNGFCNL